MNNFPKPPPPPNPDQVPKLIGLSGSAVDGCWAIVVPFAIGFWALFFLVCKYLGVI